MVSVHTARQIHAGRRAAKRARSAHPEYKDIFHPDHRPAAVGMFGFIAAFALFSLQLALSPFVTTNVRTAEQLPIDPAGTVARTTAPTRTSFPTAPVTDRMGWTPRQDVVTPQRGCYYRQVQCIQAPCPPQLVCPGETVKPVATPACGNQVCESGEADQMDPGGCGPFADPSCLGVPAQYQQGSCPQDCGAVEMPSPDRFDLNQDGQLNLADVATFKTLYRNSRSKAARARLDLNQDQKVNLMDLIALRSRLHTFRSSPSPMPTVRPSEMPRLSREQDGCRIGGCSSQFCYDPAEFEAGGPITTCEYRDSYACYNSAACGRVQGSCQWLETDELNSCLTRNQ